MSTISIDDDFFEDEDDLFDDDEDFELFDDDEDLEEGKYDSGIL